MRALVCHGYGRGENLRLEDRPMPQPGPGALRVRVLACGVNGSDWEFVSGRPAYARIARITMRRAPVLGSDIVGVVDALGPGVTGFAPGQRVFADTFGTFGGFADFAVAEAALWVPVPDDVSDVTAAALPQSGTIAITGIHDRVQAGMRVLINGGGGGSGPLAIQFAKAGGAEVWGVDVGPKAETMIRAGADHVLDFTQEDFAMRPERFDLILDLFGTRSVRRARQALAPGGRYLMVGGPMGRVLSIAAWGGLSSLGSDRKVGILAVPQGPKRLPELLAAVQEGMLAPVIGETAPLDSAAGAIARLGRAELAGKLVIRP